LKIGRDVSRRRRGRNKEKKRKKRKGGRKGERERESKGQQKRDASISHFMRKMNYALSSLLTEEREEKGIKKTKKNLKK
jgi:hypothetical protein